MKSSTSEKNLGFVFHEFYPEFSSSIIYHKFRNVISRGSPEEVPLCDFQPLLMQVLLFSPNNSEDG